LSTQGLFPVRANLIKAPRFSFITVSPFAFLPPGFHIHLPFFTLNDPCHIRWPSSINCILALARVVSLVRHNIQDFSGNLGNSRLLPDGRISQVSLCFLAHRSRMTRSRTFDRGVSLKLSLPRCSGTDIERLDGVSARNKRDARNANKNRAGRKGLERARPVR